MKKSIPLYIYILVVAVNIILSLNGRILRHYWVFDFQTSSIYMGTLKLKSIYVDRIFLIWIFVFIAALFYSLLKKTVNFLKTITIIVIAGVILLIAPRVVEFIIAGPTILLHEIISPLDVGFISKVIVICFVVVQAAIISFSLQRFSTRK